MWERCRKLSAEVTPRCDKQKWQPWPTPTLDCTSVDSNSPLRYITGIVRISCQVWIPGLSQTLSYILWTWPSCLWLSLPTSGSLRPLSITTLPVVTRTFFLQVRDDQQGALFQGMHRRFYLLYDKLALVQKTTILVSIFSHPIPCPTLQTSIRKLLLQICGTEVQCCQVLLVLVWKHAWSYSHFGVEFLATCDCYSANHIGNVELIGQLRLQLPLSSCKAICWLVYSMSLLLLMSQACLLFICKQWFAELGQGHWWSTHFNSITFRSRSL